MVEPDMHCYNLGTHKEDLHSLTYFSIFKSMLSTPLTGLI